MKFELELEHLSVDFSLKFKGPFIFYQQSLVYFMSNL